MTDIRIRTYHNPFVYEDTESKLIRTKLTEVLTCIQISKHGSV